jgi:hypothetical protein
MPLIPYRFDARTTLRSDDLKKFKNERESFTFSGSYYSEEYFTNIIVKRIGLIAEMVLISIEF